MNSRQFREIRLCDFRCFHEKQKARLAPLTLLVGNNSTGKTSFLAAIRAVWEIAHERIEPDFRKPPYDLGGFGGLHTAGEDGEVRRTLLKSVSLEAVRAPESSSMSRSSPGTPCQFHS